MVAQDRSPEVKHLGLSLHSDLAKRLGEVGYASFGGTLPATKGPVRRHEAATKPRLDVTEAQMTIEAQSTRIADDAHTINELRRRLTSTEETLALTKAAHAEASDQRDAYVRALDDVRDLAVAPLLTDSSGIDPINPKTRIYFVAYDKDVIEKHSTLDIVRKLRERTDAQAVVCRAVENERSRRALRGKKRRQR